MGFPRAVTSFILLSLVVSVTAQTQQGDAFAMQALKKSLKLPTSLDWSNADPCRWDKVQCSNGRVTRIQIGSQAISGTLPPHIQDLTSLQRFEVMNNHLTGALPSFSGLSQLQVVLLHNNNFSSIPSDFFSGMTSLQVIDLSYNSFSAWEIPNSLLDAPRLQNFSANGANVVGKIPDFINADNFPGMVELQLAMNNLEGGLPSGFVGSPIQSLWLNGQNSHSKLNGTIEVLANMTRLGEVWLHGNCFSGPIPDLSNLKNLWFLSLRDNQLTAVVPDSLLKLPRLKYVNLTNNLLQGPTPAFGSSVTVDMSNIKSFCLPNPGIACDSRVTTLLSIVQSMGYPVIFAQDWTGNNPCDTENPWTGISCSRGNITLINFQRMDLTGTISPDYSRLTSLQKLLLSSNDLNGTIPYELTEFPNLQVLDVSNNRLHGVVPPFRNGVRLKVDGNPDIAKNISGSGSLVSTSTGGNKKFSIGGHCWVLGWQCFGGIFSCIFMSTYMPQGTLSQHLFHWREENTQE